MHPKLVTGIALLALPAYATEPILTARFDPIDIAVYGIAISPDNDSILLGGHGSVSLVTITSGEEQLRVQDPGFSFELENLAFTPDGNHFISTTYHTSVVRLWNIKKAILERTFVTELPVTSAEIPIHDDYVLATAGNRAVAFEIASGNKTILWDSCPYQHPLQRALCDEYAYDISVATTGWMAISYGDYVVVRDRSGKKNRHYANGNTADTGHFDKMYSVAISPNGELLATSSVDRRTKVWNISNGRLLYSLDTGWLKDIRFHPDRKLLLSNEKYGSVRDALTGKIVWQFEPPKMRQNATRIAISKDGLLVATSHGYGGAVVWKISKADLSRLKSWTYEKQ